MNPPASLCESCRHEKDIVSGRGSRFLLCTLSQTDKRYPKYPPQPVVRCAGYSTLGKSPTDDEHKP